MTKKLHKIYLGLILGLALSFSFSANAQVAYSQNFSTSEHGWSEDYFSYTTENACGSGSIEANLFDFIGLASYAETVSPSVGATLGGEVVLTYSYKIIDYFDDAPVNGTPNTPDWGSFVVQYATSASGPWTTVQTVSPANHVVSLSCATKTVSFFPPSSPQLFFKLAATLNDGSEADYLIYLGTVTANELPQIACSGTPAAATTIAANATLCGNQNASLSLSTNYVNSGITFQWQKSTDNVTYTNIAGATSGTYSGPQTVSTYYKAVITCTNSTMTATSTPVQVISSGLACTNFCSVSFSSAVEPITLVNFAGINNPTSPLVNGTPALEDFSALSAPLVVIGQTYPISVQGNTDGSYTNYVNVFFDWNHDGEFSGANESFEVGTLVSSTGADAQQATASIQVPVGAATGSTRMRVVKLYGNYAETGCVAGGYGQVEDYTINVQESLGTSDFTANKLTFYPNPVNDILNLSYAENISSVKVFNLLGQEVLSQKANETSVQLNLSELTSGTYIVKINAGDAIKTIKVLKK